MRRTELLCVRMRTTLFYRATVKYAPIVAVRNSSIKRQRPQRIEFVTVKQCAIIQPSISFMLRRTQLIVPVHPFPAVITPLNSSFWRLHPLLIEYVQT